MTTIAQADQIFGRCISWQHVYQRRFFASFADYINQAYCDNLISQCKKNKTLHNNITNLLEVDQNDYSHPAGDSMAKRQAIVKKLLALIDTNIPALLAYLKDHHFASQTLNQRQSVNTVDNVVNQYALLLNTLFYHEDKLIQSEYLFSIANLFFEYCFSDDTCDDYFAILHNEADYPLARMIHSILWEFLSADGWRNWHADSLSFLRKESDAGKTVVYVAGATDVYQLLKFGIYNIEVIDPLLPSQANDYYAEGWSWLVNHENIGDQINVTDDVMLRRDSHQSFGTFHVTMPTGELFDIEHTHTTWCVCSRRSSQVLGKLVFKRRFAVQDDFLFNPTSLLLVSFNELYLLSAPPDCAGWGIDAYALLDDMIIVVKQLSKPITATTFKRLTRASETPFKFVNLGAAAT